MNATDAEVFQLNLLYKNFPKFFVWDARQRTWTKKNQGSVIGRLCVVNPLENERYYLRVLLNNVPAPTSFENIRTVRGVRCATFQQASYGRGLLHNDDDIEKTMEEASIYGMAPELRRLFVTLLHYCNPSNPKKLFESYFECMADDFKRLQPQMMISDHDILCKVLQGINDTLESVGKDVNQYRLVSFHYSTTDFERYTRQVAVEKNIPVPQEDLRAIHQLNELQKAAFDIIFDCAMSNKPGAFFVDGPGGTGKSFLYKVLLAHIRSKGHIALIVASSSIAASGFLSGRTTHSRFKIPLDAQAGTKCLISYQSSEADLIRQSKIVIWDEAPMTNKFNIEAVNKMLKDLCKNELPFGGKLIVFGGDFRQVLPVIRRGTRIDQVSASMVTLDLWGNIIKLPLTENMRTHEDPDFIEYLMRIGNGTEPVNSKGQIEIQPTMIIPYTSFDESIEVLIQLVYPDMSLFQRSPFEMMDCTILCPKNEFVDDINSRLIQRIPGDEVIYISDDQAKNFVDQGDYVDYFNTLEPKGLPQHRLVLKVNCPVILLRNINPVEGLCNGTRLICKQLSPNLIGAVIATGQFQGKHVWIPRIPLEPNTADNKYMIPFVRKQFPLRMCFAMTINKSQGQTLSRVGLYLRHPVFAHGQLYVAFSRARTGENVRILIIPPTFHDETTRYTANVVYNEVLLQAGLA